MENGGTKPIEDFVQLYDNKWFRIKSVKNFQFMCCDCSLVHTMKWKKVGKRLHMMVAVNKEETKKARKEKS